MAIPLLMSVAVLISYIGNAKGEQPIPIKTITIEGDIFDCVDIHKQPAFDHPLLKNHEILMKPSGNFEGSEEEGEGGGDSYSNSEIDLRLKDGGCPLGMVPIQRLPNNGTDSVSTPPTMPYMGMEQTSEDPFSHMWAIRYGRQDAYFGGSAEINVYGVHPMSWKDSSGAALWVLNNASADQISVIRAGWSVSPGAFNDYHTRSMVEWSIDNDRSGCINLRCPGFVQVSHDIGLGGKIVPLSNYKAKVQYVIKLFVYKDDKDNWWFAYGDMKKVIGYWPAELFKGKFKVANNVQVGGVVSCPKGKICPPMGNGHSPHRDSGGMWNACFIRRVLISYKDQNTWENLQARYQSLFNSCPRCYDVGFYWDFIALQGAYKFTFGGPPCPPNPA